MKQATWTWGVLVFLIWASGCGLQQNQLGNLEAKGRGAEPDIPLAQAAFDLELAEACGDGAAVDGAFTRQPYLQQVRDDGMRVLWASEVDGNFELDISEPGGELVEQFEARPDASGEALAGSRQFAASVDGLQPDHVYCYAVRDADGEVMGRTGFRTAPAPGQAARVSFVAFGDSGYDGLDQEAIFDQMRSVPADLMLSVGDLAYGRGTVEQLEHLFFEPYAPMLRSIPAYVVAGNHDYDTRGGAPFRAMFALPENGGERGRERWYSFDRGPVHFVGLDSEVDLHSQAEWLEQDLSDNRLPWVVVMVHRPPYSSGAHGSTMVVREAFSPIFEAHGVQLVLAGHEHDYERSVPIEGTTYVVTGGGGRGTRDVGHSSFTAYSEAVAHFIYVTVDGADMRLYAVDGTGETFDFAHIVEPDAT
ncbi:MAG: metallophosphoesterase [Myxococcales bacterium]|jgi:hypothetical protein